MNSSFFIFLIELALKSIIINKKIVGVERMKNIAQIKKEMSALEVIKNEFIYSNVKPSQVIMDTYQYVYDFLYRSLEKLKQEFIEKLVTIKSNSDKEDHRIRNYESFISGIDLIMEELSQYIVIAGGCLSEQFIEGYQQDFKDIDFFVDVSLFRHFENQFRYIDANNQEVLPSYFHLFLKEQFYLEKNEFEIKEQTVDANYGEDNNIIEVFRKEMNGLKIEIILLNRFVFDFDLGFRDYYYNGDTIFYSKKAEVDFKNKEISIKSFSTPFSTLLRFEEFGNRYPLTIDSFSKELLMKFIQFRYKSDENKIKEKFSRIKKYNSDEKSSKITNKIMSFNLTPFEISIFESIDLGIEDHFYLFSDRIKMILEDEKNKVPYKLTQSFPITPFESGYTFSVNERHKEMFYTELKKIIQLTKIKRIFIQNVEDLVVYFRKELFAFSDAHQMDIGFQALYFDQLIASKAINGFLLDYELNKNPRYSKKEFFNDALFSSEKETEMLYDAVMTNRGFIKTSISHLIFEFKVPTFQFSYSGEKSSFIDLHLLPDFGGNATHPPSYTNVISNVAFGTEFGYFYGDRWKNIKEGLLTILQCNVDFINRVPKVKKSSITASKALT